MFKNLETKYNPILIKLMNSINFLPLDVSFKRKIGKNVVVGTDPQLVVYFPFSPLMSP